MRPVRVLLVWTLFLTLGTYAVPSWRVGGALSLPLAVALAAALGVVVLLERPLPGRDRWPPRIFRSGMAYVLSLAISSGPALHFDRVRVLKATLLLASTLLIVVVARDFRTIRRATVCLGISSLGVFCYGVYGYLTGSVGDEIEHSFGYFGVTYTQATRNTDVMYFQTAFWILVSLGLFGTIGIKRRRLALLAAVPVVLGIVMSQARGAWISTGCTLALALWKGYRVRLKSTLVVIGTVTAALCVWAVVNEVAPQESDGDSVAAAIERLGARAATLSTLEEPEGGNSNRVRLALLQRGLLLAVEKPLGVGLGNARYYLKELELNHFENEYMQLLVEQSVLGLGAMVLLFWGMVRSGWGHVRRGTVDPAERWVGWALVLMMIDWSIYGLFNVLHESTWFWLVLGLGLAWLTSAENASDGSERCSRAVGVALPTS